MAEQIAPLRHAEHEKQDDGALKDQARAHLTKSPAVQLVAELLEKLRGAGLPWWTAEQTRAIWNAQTRMMWFKERADLRQKITSGLTGLAPRAARNKTPDFQASLIDSVIEDGDVTVTQFDAAFDVADLAAYGPLVEIWQKFRERFPWDQDTPPHQELFGWLLEALLASTSSLAALEGATRRPILTAYAVRTSIPGKTWHTRIPLEVRVAIDDLRFQREKAKPGEPFHAAQDLTVATPAILASNIPLRELARILDATERALGLSASAQAGRSVSPAPVARESSFTKTSDANPAPPANPPPAGWTAAPSHPPAKALTEPPLSAPTAVTAPTGRPPVVEEAFAFDDEDDTTGKAKKRDVAATKR
jgi:hypothetical protein